MLPWPGLREQTVELNRLLRPPSVCQGGSCELKGKLDKQDFLLLVQCFETIGLHADQISTVWAILSSILQLGNICFSSYEVCVREWAREGECILRGWGVCLCSKRMWVVQSSMYFEVCTWLDVFHSFVCLIYSICEKQTVNKYLIVYFCVYLEWVVWGGPYLQWGRGQESRFSLAGVFRGPTDCHHTQSHGQNKPFAMPSPFNLLELFIH